jgi:hypothetical protein
MNCFFFYSEINKIENYNSIDKVLEVVFNQSKVSGAFWVVDFDSFLDLYILLDIEKDKIEEFLIRKEFKSYYSFQNLRLKLLSLSNIEIQELGVKWCKSSFDVDTNSMDITGFLIDMTYYLRNSKDDEKELFLIIEN